MGDISKFPKTLQEKLIKVQQISKHHKGLVVNIVELLKNEPDFYESCFHGKDEDFLKEIDRRW